MIYHIKVSIIYIEFLKVWNIWKMGNSIKTESPSQVLDFIPEKFEIGPKVA